MKVSTPKTTSKTEAGITGFMLPQKNARVKLMEVLSLPFFTGRSAET
jgi:hypothetical protein